MLRVLTSVHVAFNLPVHSFSLFQREMLTTSMYYHYLLSLYYTRTYLSGLKNAKIQSLTDHTKFQFILGALRAGLYQVPIARQESFPFAQLERLQIQCPNSNLMTKFNCMLWRNQSGSLNLEIPLENLWVHILIIITTWAEIMQRLIPNRLCQ